MFGKEQSPINITKAYTTGANVQNNYSLRFRYNTQAKNPGVKVEVSEKKFVIEVSDVKKESFGEVVVSIPENPNTHISYNAKRIWFKTPSEHSIDFIHSPMEVQVEHHIDLLKSLIYPRDIMNSTVRRVMMLSFLASSGMNNPLLKQFFPLDLTLKSTNPDDKKSPIADVPFFMIKRMDDLIMPEKIPEAGAPLTAT